MLVCDKCTGAITVGANFCPHCGDPVTEADRATPVTINSGVANVEISFGPSTSTNFQKAINICQNLPSYQQSGEGKEAIYRIQLPITEIELLINIYDLVGSWKSSQMLINGHSASKKDLAYYGAGCYRNRQKAYKPDQYCFGEREFEANIWGCKRLNMPINEWGGGWLDYGEFDKSGVWHFDKERIRHDLEIVLKENELCPVLSRVNVIETLARLPDRIDPKTDKNWSYRTSYEEVKGHYKEVAIGIRPILKKMNRFVVGDYKPNWDTAYSDSTNNQGEVVIENQVVEPASKGDIYRSNEPETRSNNKIWWGVAGIVILWMVFS